ncbi:MAG: proton-conducting transporter membrane subunit [Litorilinea sp.]
MNGAEMGAFNLPLVILGSLVGGAAFTYGLRGFERLSALVGAAVSGLWAIWLWQLDLADPVRPLPFGLGVVDLREPAEQLGFVLRLETGALPVLAGTMGITAAACLLASLVRQGRPFAPIALLLASGYVLAGLITTGPLAPALMTPLFLVMLAAIGVFVLHPGLVPAGQAATDAPTDAAAHTRNALENTTAGALRSLLPTLLAFPFFLIAAWYVEQISLNPQDTQLAFMAAQFIAVGLLLLFAPAPFHGGHPSVTQTAPPIAATLVNLLYQLAVLNLLYQAVLVFPFIPQLATLGSWLTWAGLTTAVWGGVAAAGSTDPGRLWGYASLHDWGLVMLVLASPGVGSWPLVLFIFGLRAVSMFTAAAGLAVLVGHAGGTRLDQFQGIGSRMPWSSAAYLLGGLGLAGFPLSAGFTGHWAAVQILAESDWQLAAVVLVASGGAIFGFVRMARVMFGPLVNRFLPHERWLEVILAVMLLGVSLSLAMAPQLLDGPIGRALLAFGG